MSIDCTIQEQTGEAFYQPRMCGASQVLFSVFPQLLAVLGWNANGPWISEITIIWASFCICVSITRCDWVNEEKAVTGKAKTYRFAKSLSILRGDFLGRGVGNGKREEHMQIWTKRPHARDSSASAQWASWQTSRPAQLTNETSQKAPHLLIIPRILF